MMRMFALIIGCAAIAVFGAYVLQQREEPRTTNDAALHREVEQLRAEVRQLRAERDVMCEQGTTTMPDLRGMDVQLAQDRMQAMDVWKFVKRDASEKRRALLWDRNWIVVRQTPRPCTFVDGRATVSVWARKRGD